jgi:hypothetical protein
MGGRSIRSGNFNQFPFVAAGFSSSTTPAAEYGFALVDVTPGRLTVSYIAADDGEVIDSFSITVPEPTTGIMLLIGMATMLTGGRTLVSKLNSA